MVRIGDGKDVIKGVYHNLPKPLSNQAVIDEVFGSLGGPMAVGAGTVEWRVSKVVPLGSGFFHSSPHCSQKNGITRPLYRRREQAGSGSDEGCRELGWGYLNHVFIQICGIAAGEGAPVPLVPYRPKEEISGLIASRWVFAHKRFAVEYCLVGFMRMLKQRLMRPIYIRMDFLMRTGMVI